MTKSFHFFIIAAALLLLNSSEICASAAESPLNCTHIEKILQKAMKCYHYHQMHVAVVFKQNLICQLRMQLNENNSITEITHELQLYLASVSKGMFGTALGLMDSHLEKESGSNKYQSLFKKPLKEIFGSDFWFLDQKRTDLITVDDILSHSVGLNRHDAMWYLQVAKDKQDVFRKTSRLHANNEFRDSFVYNNLLWTAADLAVSNISKMDFTEYMNRFLWLPLQMLSTCSSSESCRSVAAAGVKEAAIPAANYRPEIFNLPFSSEPPMQNLAGVEAAGGIRTTLSDMVKYMKYQTNFNYSSFAPVPPHFVPQNAQFASAGFNQIFNPNLFQPNITNLPQASSESYARGWMRSWYRNNLLLSHSGSLFGLLCELDVYPEQQLSIFHHVTLGATQNPVDQSIFQAMIDKLIADQFLTTTPFINEDNVCNLLRSNAPDVTLATLSRRELTESQLKILIGEFGNYGFGKVKVQMTEDRSKSKLVMTFGDAKVNLWSVKTNEQFASNNNFQFLIDVLEPAQISSKVVLNFTESEITLYKSSKDSPLSYALFIQNQQKVEMQAPSIEVNLKFQKGLEPNNWKIPELCPKSASQGFSALTVISFCLIFSNFAKIICNLF